MECVYTVKDDQNEAKRNRKALEEPGGSSPGQGHKSISSEIVVSSAKSRSPNSNELQEMFSLFGSERETLKENPPPLHDILMRGNIWLLKGNQVT